MYFFGRYAHFLCSILFFFDTCSLVKILIVDSSRLLKRLIYQAKLMDEYIKDSYAENEFMITRGGYYYAINSDDLIILSQFQFFCQIMQMINFLFFLTCRDRGRDHKCLQTI